MSLAINLKLLDFLLYLFTIKKKVNNFNIFLFINLLFSFILVIYFKYYIKVK